MTTPEFTTLPCPWGAVSQVDLIRLVRRVSADRRGRLVIIQRRPLCRGWSHRFPESGPHLAAALGQPARVVRPPWAVAVFRVPQPLLPVFRALLGHLIPGLLITGGSTMAATCPLVDLRPPADCCRIVIRLQQGVKSGCDRNGRHPRLLLKRMDRRQSVQWGKRRAQGPQPGGERQPGADLSRRRQQR
jgi:hypothetical protein